MKRILILFAAVLFLGACNDDFKVGADYKEVTIVYGLLDPAAPGDQHYIKVNKGFYSETENNLVVARNKDSIYFNDLTVTVEEFDNGNRTNSFNCIKTDVYSLPSPIVKQEGIFTDSPNYAYVFNHKLDANRIYKLTVKNNESGKVVTGETAIINVAGNNFEVIRPFTAFDQLQFSNPTKQYVFSWKAPALAALFDINLRFHYGEKNVITNITEKKSVVLPLAKFIKRTGNSISHSVDNENFYSLLAGSIGAAPVNTQRFVDTAELYFVAGDNELKNYIEVNNAQGGLTADQIKPNYPNLQGEDVIGIFACRAIRNVGFITYDDATYDSLINASFTKSLKFIGRSPD